MSGDERLYHVEIIDRDGDLWVEWVWAADENSANPVNNHSYEPGDEPIRCEVRQATPEEQDAWETGWGEAIGTGIAEERLANWNGVTYNVDSLFPLVTKQMFRCAICEQTYAIENAARLGEFYLSVQTRKENQENKSVLWHVCINCSKE